MAIGFPGTFITAARRHLTTGSRTLAPADGNGETPKIPTQTTSPAPWSAGRTGLISFKIPAPVSALQSRHWPEMQAWWRRWCRLQAVVGPGWIRTPSSQACRRYTRQLRLHLRRGSPEQCSKLKLAFFVYKNEVVLGIMGHRDRHFLHKENGFCNCFLNFNWLLTVS